MGGQDNQLQSSRLAPIKEPSPELLELERAILAVAEEIASHPNATPEMTTRYNNLFREYAEQEPRSYCDVAAMLRMFEREAEHNEYHNSDLPQLIRSIILAAERLAATDFDRMVEELSDTSPFLPRIPTSQMLAAGAHAGAVAIDLVKKIYAAMVEAHAEAEKARR